MVALFAALFVNLNYLQVVRAEDLATNSANARQLVEEYESERGRILIGQGPGTRPIAESVETDGELRFLRTYESGPLLAHVTGFSSPIFGRSEIERAFNEQLTGNAPEAFIRNVADLLAGRERAGDAVHSTVRAEVQQAARDALGDREGAVVALEPATGAILALWSSPTYDPNELASHDPQQVRNAWERLNDDPTEPLLNRAVREAYPPGSTFKLVTAAAALEAGVSPDQTFSDPVALDLPQTTATIGNFSGGTCNGGTPITLTQALTVSCNTTFAQLGLELPAAGGRDQPRPVGSRSPCDRSERDRSTRCTRDTAADGDGHGGHRQRRRRHDAARGRSRRGHVRSRAPRVPPRGARRARPAGWAGPQPQLRRRVAGDDGQRGRRGQRNGRPDQRGRGRRQDGDRADWRWTSADRVVRRIRTGGQSGRRRRGHGPRRWRSGRRRNRRSGLRTDRT
jgi:cell division protein FtsI/penicillin-binding protein 2